MSMKIYSVFKADKAASNPRPADSKPKKDEYCVVFSVEAVPGQAGIECCKLLVFEKEEEATETAQQLKDGAISDEDAKGKARCATDVYTKQALKTIASDLSDKGRIELTCVRGMGADELRGESSIEGAGATGESSNVRTGQGGESTTNDGGRDRTRRAERQYVRTV